MAAPTPSPTSPNADLAPALELREVTKVYGSAKGAQVRALDGVTLTIERGEAVGIVGPSGSGKSTLLNIMGTLDRPSSGQVFVSGWEVSKLRDDAVAAIRARSIGFVFQQFFLLDNRSAVDNVADGLLYAGIGRSERRRRALSALGRVGLSHRASHKPNELSGGECQRVAIARALVHDPDILLADEPTGNLDSATGEGILDLFASLHESGSTIAVITHDPTVARRFTRVISLWDGKIESGGER